MKVPEPRKLPSGNYYIQMVLGGVSVSVTRPTARECKREAELIKAEHRNKKRRMSTAESMTLREAMQAYVDKKEEPLSPSTIRSYTSIINNRLKAVKDTQIRAITDWQEVINAECREVKPKTVANVWGLVTATLQYHNIPIPSVTLPAVPENDLPWIEPEELLNFVDAVKGHRHEIGILMALHGLRRSEIVAVPWENVNLKKGTIKVSGAMVYNKNNKLVAKDTNKTKNSTRTVRIMIPRLTEALEAVEDKTGRVVSCSPDTLYRSINSVCASMEQKGVGCHGLRRSFASLGYQLRWSERALMAAGGWRDAGTMHKHYVKLAQREADENSQKMEAFFTRKENSDGNPDDS